MKITRRRQDVLNAFKSLEKKSDAPPSLSSVARECKMTVPTVHGHVQHLHDAGLLKRTEYGAGKGKPYYKYHAAKRCPTCGKRC